MTLLITSLQIEGFRVLANLQIDSFGRVNLITGKNNAGKSSLLEAIRILATGGAPRTIRDILNYRQELGGPSDTERSYLPNDLSPFSNLFTGFPDLSAGKSGFSLSATGALPTSISRIHGRINWFVRREYPDRQGYSLEEITEDPFDEAEAFPAFDLDISGRRRILSQEQLQRRVLMRADSDAAPVPCVYVDPFSSRSTHEMGALWDAIALTDVEGEVVRAIQLIDENIQAVSVIGSDDRTNRPRTAIAKSTRHSSPVPLRTFGDGVNRLFGIVLALCNARNGVLLVDEIENGLHYSVQPEIWRSLFRLANTLNVQVFATSHSWDCVRAFQEAASESPEDGVLVRLSRRDEKIIPTLFTAQELKIVTRDQIEVR